MKVISIAFRLLIQSLVLVSNDVLASNYVLVNDVLNLWRERTIDEYEWSHRRCMKLAYGSERAKRLTRPSREAALPLVVRARHTGVCAIVPTLHATFWLIRAYIKRLDGKGYQLTTYYSHLVSFDACPDLLELSCNDIVT